MTYVIALPCVDLKDKACIDECPVDCIYEGDRMLYIHPDECVDCGACEPVCPVEAIYYEDDVPDKWSDYYARQRRVLLGDRLARWRREDGPDRPRPRPHQGAASAERVSAPPWACNASALPDFPWDSLDALRRAGVGPSRRHRQPVRRHAHRPHAAGGARRAGARGRCPRLSGNARHARACGRRWRSGSRGAGGCRTWTLPGCCRRSAPRSLWRSCPRCWVWAKATWWCIPSAAYPTYDVGARLGGRHALPLRRRRRVGGQPRGQARVGELAVEPHGRRPGVADSCGRSSTAARAIGAVVASDECYAELAMAGAVDHATASRRSWTPRWRARTTRACWRCTRCPSSPTLRATGPRSRRAIPR